MTTIKVVTAKSTTDATSNRVDRFNAAYNSAMELLCMCDLEIRSALKESGNRNGIAWGDEMGEFVHYAEKRMGL